MSYNVTDNTYTGYIYKITNDINNKVYIGQTITTIADRWHGHMSSVLNEKRYKSALYNAMRKYGREKFHIKEISSFTKATKGELIDTLNIEEQKYIKYYQSLITQNGYNLEKGGNNKRVPGRKVHKYDLELNYICSYESCEEAGRQNNIDGCTIYSCCKHDYYTAGGYIWSFDNEEPVNPYSELPYFLKNMQIDMERKYKLYNLGWNGERIFQYNAYGEVINVFSDLIDAKEKLNISYTDLRYNLSGKNKKFKKSVLRYESMPFNAYSISPNLQPITLYDLQGNFVRNFETKADAETFLGCPSGEITKVLKRGGSCHNYLISEYGKPLQRKVNRCEKTIYMIDEDGSIVKEFPTIKDINLYFKIKDCHHSLNKAIKNRTKYRDYYWKYKEEFAIA